MNSRQAHTSRCLQVLPLSVEPGFGGQKFQPAAMDKVRALRQRFPSIQIEVGLPCRMRLAALCGMRRNFRLMSNGFQHGCGCGMSCAIPQTW